jgi:uncharacterized protein YceK
MRKALMCAALAVAPLFAGCASSQNWAAEKPSVYGGTKTDLALISGSLGPNADPEKVRKIAPTVKAYACCCGMVDLPFSLVADTLMLPVVAPRAYSRDIEKADKAVDAAAAKLDAQAEEAGRAIDAEAAKLQTKTEETAELVNELKRLQQNRPARSWE